MKNVFPSEFLVGPIFVGKLVQQLRLKMKRFQIFKLDNLKHLKSPEQIYFYLISRG